jgi:hypothetical protein
LGAGDLGAPPLSYDGAASWLDQRDTAIASFALLRLLALGLGWYLLFVTAVGGATRYFRLQRMTSLLERLTPRFARGILGGMALLGVVAAPPPLPPQTDSMIELPSDATAVLHLLPDAPASTPASAPASAAEPLPVPAPADIDVTSWEIQPGDSFWSVAAEHLADIRGGEVSEREVGSYWRQVVEVNRSRLVNPNDADLLFTGQVIELPAVAPG